jgi:Flp pilus assembly protein TadG
MRSRTPSILPPSHRHAARAQEPRDATWRQRGQSLVEFGLILPVFLLLFATTLDLGRLAFAQVTVTNAAREGAFQAAKTPTSFDSTQPCPSGATSNRVVCRVQLEARSSGVTIAPSDIGLTCSPVSCASGIGNRVTVRVTGHFTLLTPVMAVFFGGSRNITFSAVSTAQIETLPPAPSSSFALSTPTPTPTGSPTPTPTPTSAICTLPSAGFTSSPSDLTSLHAPLTLAVVDKSTSPNCAIGSWFWTWGDGTTSSVQNPGSHTYVAKGTYTVTLKVTNSTGSNTTGGLTFTVKP